VVGTAITEYSKVSAELELIKTSSPDPLIETNDAKIVQLRAEIELIEGVNRKLKIRQSEQCDRAAELEATKQILMELTLREGRPIMI
jgi:hypothetical protein